MEQDHVVRDRELGEGLDIVLQARAQSLLVMSSMVLGAEAVHAEAGADAPLAEAVAVVAVGADIHQYMTMPCRLQRSKNLFGSRSNLR
jgi:hypothetical protein